MRSPGPPANFSAMPTSVASPTSPTPCPVRPSTPTYPSPLTPMQLLPPSHETASLYPYTPEPSKSYPSHRTHRCCLCARRVRLRWASCLSSSHAPRFQSLSTHQGPRRPRWSPSHRPPPLQCSAQHRWAPGGAVLSANPDAARTEAENTLTGAAVIALHACAIARRGEDSPKTPVRRAMAVHTRIAVRGHTFHTGLLTRRGPAVTYNPCREPREMPISPLPLSLSRWMPGVQPVLGAWLWITEPGTRLKAYGAAVISWRGVSVVLMH